MTGTTTLPLFPLGTVLFPRAQLPLHLFEDRDRKLMREHLHDDPIFGVVLTETGVEVGDEPAIHQVGTAACLLAASEFPDGRWAIVVEGTRRFSVLRSTWEHGYLTGDVCWVEEGVIMTDAHVGTWALIDSFVAYLGEVGVDLAEKSSITGIEAGLRDAFNDDLDGLIYLIADQLPLNTWHRQRILETISVVERYAQVRDLLRQERAIVRRGGAMASLTTNPAAKILPN